MKERIGPLIGAQELGDAEETMPFLKEGALWVWCMICDEEVKVNDSVPVSRNQTFRACKTHYKHHSGGDFK